MRKARYLFYYCLCTLCCLSVSASGMRHSERTKKIEEVRNIMIRVGDYQLGQSWPAQFLKSHPLGFGDRSWRAGIYYTGIFELYKVTNNKKYLDRLFNVADNNKWMQGERLMSADDQAILQLYLDLYTVRKDKKFIESTKNMLDSTFLTCTNVPSMWTWSDALFMAPPVFAKYAQLTKNKKALDFMNNWWWQTIDDLYDAEYKLVYRDIRFKTMKSPNGKPLFWGRGNGWVIAGLARVLNAMPQDYPDRSKYIKLLKELSEGIKNTQQPDGFWRSNLLDPEAFPVGETSGTVMFCYGLAWGVNQGILSKAEYIPIIKRAWKAIVSAIDENGRLGFVQSGGDRPHPTTYSQTEFYAVGGLMYAGAEIIKLIKKDSYE